VISPQRVYILFSPQANLLEAPDRNKEPKSPRRTSGSGSYGRIRKSDFIIRIALYKSANCSRLINVKNPPKCTFTPYRGHIAALFLRKAHLSASKAQNPNLTLIQIWFFWIGKKAVWLRIPQLNRITLKWKGLFSCSTKSRKSIPSQVFTKNFIRALFLRATLSIAVKFEGQLFDKWNQLIHFRTYETASGMSGLRSQSLHQGGLWSRALLIHHFLSLSDGIPNHGR